MASAPPRPPALTLTCVFLGVGSLLVVLELVDALSSWGSIELQDSLREALDSPELSGLDIGLDPALEVTRWAVLALVALAGCALVFTVYAARGHRASRVALTVLCVGAAIVLALGGGLAGLLPALFASICASSLWSPEARRWFDAVDGRPVAHPTQPAAATRGPAGVDPFAGGPPPPGAAPVEHPHHDTLADPTAHPTADPIGAPAARPKQVDRAVTVTFVAAGVVGLLGLLMLLLTTVGADAYRSVLTEPGAVQDLLDGSGLDVDSLITLLRWASVSWLVLCTVAVVAGVAAVRRQRRGIAALAGVSGVTLAYSLIFLPLGLVTIAAAVYVLVQLRHPRVRTWLQSPA